ncbi:putative MFS family arabinose efflux permease [Salsuginibacillus halophilus]|uniref:Putative MFS family arabinose efflux permease n=1 Tax=Salsuginibacillus halophilus TaxID=517424 RepID=A0A2P8HBJ1_9BACI|nr:MFS transporter [Salsuginibacillus halophilus]PSL43594.1 putative MFS family arabinose efflux permease [Salsuginibacillus halophilus]
MQQTNNPTYRYWLLVSLVLVAGFVQGMLLPVLAVLLEEAGITSTANGLNATALYIGILLASPFIEQPLRKFGYKPLITTGVIAVVTALLILPLWQAFWFWFVLRMIIGIGDNLIHFATQVWITSTADPAKRGRSLAIYGLAFGMGFGVGPIMTQLLTVHESLPFLITAFSSLFVWLFLLRLKNEWPSEDFDDHLNIQMPWMMRYKQTIKLAWFALLPGFSFGYLEASIHGSYPIYAIRAGISLDWVTIFLPAFVFGSLITQLPLGMLSDRWGRKRVLMLLLASGFIIFSSMPMLESSMIALLTGFSMLGMLLGSLYSLGLMYLADLLPKQLLPTGNVLMAISFSLGSMSGPVAGGIVIDQFGTGSIYLSMAFMLFIIWSLGWLFHPNKNAPDVK